MYYTVHQENPVQTQWGALIPFWGMPRLRLGDLALSPGLEHVKSSRVLTQCRLLSSCLTAYPAQQQLLASQGRNDGSSAHLRAYVFEFLGLGVLAFMGGIDSGLQSA